MADFLRARLCGGVYPYVAVFRQSFDKGCAFGAAVHQVHGIFSAGEIAEGGAVHVFPAAGERQGEGVFRRGGQLLQVVEALRGAQGAAGAVDAASLQEGVVGGELPLQDAERLAEGGDAEVEVDLVERKRGFEEYLRIAPGGGVGASFAYQQGHVELLRCAGPAAEGLVGAAPPRVEGHGGDVGVRRRVAEGGEDEVERGGIIK